MYSFNGCVIRHSSHMKAVYPLISRSSSLTGGTYIFALSIKPFRGLIEDVEVGVGVSSFSNLLTSAILRSRSNHEGSACSDLKASRIGQLKPLMGF